ncbi:alkylhydroperoxidase [Burkholderia contaminans]|uniref:hypothetical protein n=1 Tax=Burkholderia contaminans TaxID=488447 RepID=UPI001453102E|nr:hypothetical protein [Burkholderia contaminans]VWC60170.1 alkylhydroperoxidase [Burkholderia contaminans]
MSRIAIPAVEIATGATADVYAPVRKVAGGTVPNLFAAVEFAHPAVVGIPEDRAAAQHDVLRDLVRRQSLIRDRLRRTERAAYFELPGDHDERHEAAEPVGFEHHAE